MTLIRRLPLRLSLVSALGVLLMAPLVTQGAVSQRSKKSVRAVRQVSTKRNALPGKRASGLSLVNQRRQVSSRTLRRRAAIEQAYAAKRRRAEVQRQADMAHQRALDEAMRNEVQSMIARDDISGEDEQVRRVAVSALGIHAGTVVVMDPNTGRVYTIVNQEWALRRGFKPCSTIKLVTGVAGLNEKVIDPVDMTRTSGAYHLNLTDALAYSNNTYFQQVGGRVGFDKMLSYARQLGLGQKTGINSPNEFAGAVPMFKSGFAVNHMSSHGDNFQVTALQLATLVSAMANGGKLLAPYIPHTPQEEAKLKSRVRRQLNIDPEALTRMIPGMVGSVNYGSGRRAYNQQETVAGKTGTCIGEGGWVGLFTSYAPLASPRLAVVVIARGSDAHGHFPAAVAGQIYRDLSSRFGTQTNLQIADRSSDPRTEKIDPKSALNEEDTEAGAAAPGNSVIPSTNPTNNRVRRVLMQMQMPTPNRNQKPVPPAADSNAAPQVGPQEGLKPRRAAGNQP